MAFWAILSGLASAASWGAGDFAGGLASRRVSAVRMVLASQLIGTLALVALGMALGEPPAAPGDVAVAAVAGMAGGIGLLLLYVSLARGKMGVAAPLTAVAAGGIPLLVGMATQGLPGVLQIVGFLLALVAIWVISRSGDGGGRLRPADIVLPLLAGVGFGLFLALIGLVGQDAAFIRPLVAARLSSMALMAVVLVVGWMRGGRERTTDDGPQTTVGDRRSFPWALAALAGLGDTAGNVFFVLSSQLGRLDVAAVLGALYPAVTVLLARLVLGERLSPRQSVGVGLALGAVVMIAL